MKTFFQPILLSITITALIFIFLETIVVPTEINTNEVTVSIFEGKNIIEIDSLLRNSGAMASDHSLLSLSSGPLEGYLFPDTYRFYASSTAQAIVDRFYDNFKAKAEPLLNKDIDHYQTNLILASLIEKEVPDYSDRKIVAGILKKRLAVGMPLQIDATICYAKIYRQTDVDSVNNSCYPITKSDKQINSRYNTYLYRGLPPSPISNPGLEAIQAVLEAESSPYWYYLSDPSTDKTIFSKTLEEHNHNRYLYLSNS